MRSDITGMRRGRPQIQWNDGVKKLYKRKTLLGQNLKGNRKIWKKYRYDI